MLPNRHPDPVNELRPILGPVVFIAWPKGVKGSLKKWKHLTLTHMTPEYLAKLERGNIGVALGEVSGGLCAIDIDDDTLVEPFMAANPALADTFQTHGSRGRVFWIRCKGRYPAKTIKLKKPDGANAGEFRSGGTQSIVFGIHPNGQPYEWLVKKPAVEIDVASITWPDCFTEPALQSIPDRDGLTEKGLQRESDRETFTESGVTESELTEASEVMGSSLCASVIEATAGTINNLEDVLRICVPTKVHQNNDLLFKLARGVLNLERLEQQPYSLAQRLDVFNKWYSRSTSNLRPELSKNDYMIEFLNATKKAKRPLGGNAVDEAWSLAQSEPPPPEASMFEDKEKQLLVALCYQLQIQNGSNPFFLSSRVCQRLLGLKDHFIAGKWLDALQVMEIIKLEEKGNAMRASRYRYVTKE